MLKDVLKEIDNNTTSSSANKPVKNNPKIVYKAKPIRKSDLARNKINKNVKNTEENNEQREWPPNKYKNVKGTGYGTSWSPKIVRQSINLDQTSLKRSQSNKNLSKTNTLNRINLSNSVEFNRSKSDVTQDVSELQGKIRRS